MAVRPIVIVLHQLGYGGATKAVLDQAKLHSQNGREVAVVTFDDNTNLSARVEELYASSTIPRKVRVLNIHEYHAERSQAGPKHDKAVSPDGDRVTNGRPVEPGGSADVEVLTEAGQDSHGEYRRVFSTSGELMTMTRLHGDGTIKHVNHYENAVLVYREHYVDGRAHLRSVFNAEGETVREMFLSRDGFCYAQRWVNPKTGRGAGVFVADRSTGAVKKVSGLPAWHVSWLQEIVDGFSTAPYVVAESASAIPKVMGLRADSAVRMGMMHNSHLTAPFKVDSPLRSDYDDTFSRLPELDALVVLSERQRRDMVARIGGADVMTVVPNVLVSPDVKTVQRDGSLVSIVSRLAPQKSLHEAIHAFAHVVKKLPNARLEIYGRGPSKGELEKLVAKLKLSSNVLFMGRTSEPLEVMARSTCTISTSEWEALPLSIAESLAVGTPVVAYDCLYGPSTLIRDGETGFVVDRGDRSSLATSIIELLNDPGLAQRLGEEGRRDMKARLDVEPALAEWQEAFSWADRRYEERNSKN